MRKRFMATIMSIVMLLGMITMPATVFATETDVAEEIVVSQIETRFPTEDPSSRDMVNDRRVFKGYEGEGTINITNHGVTSGDIYINGKLVKDEDLLNKEVFDIGEYTINGENTIKVLNILPEEAYLEISIPYPVLKEGTPESVGVSSSKLAKIDEFIQGEVEEGFPGAVLLVIKDGKIIKNTAYGYSLKYDKNGLLDEFNSMSTNTMFDLASNSKMFATNMAIQKLASEGKLDFHDLVQEHIPGFEGEGREDISIYDIMTHSAGFASSIRFYMPDNGHGEDFYSLDRDRTIEILNRMPAGEYPKGSKAVYSDTDYMLLGVIVENITGMMLDEYIENEIYAPLGLEHSLFNPLDKGFEKEMFAATETQGNTRDGERDYPEVRRETIQGEVHDEKTYYCMGGVSGHAGLFSNSSDLAVLCQLVLNGGGYGDVKVFNKEVHDYAVAPSAADITYGLGWNRAGNANKTWQFGPYASDKAIGHTGWTGTLSIIDPEYDLGVILLTNKKHSKVVKGSTFEGDAFQTGMYGNIASMVYESFLDLE